MPKILLFSTGDVNGAYESIYKLALLLKEMNHNVIMMVKEKTKNDDFIINYSYPKKNIFLKTLNKVYYKLFKTKRLITYPEYNFLSPDETSKNLDYNNLLQQIPFKPEYIITGMTINFLNSTDLMHIQKLTNAQVLNITVDMNHFTGGCHYSWGCEGYTMECKNCPAIVNPKYKNIAYINLTTKAKNAKVANFNIIAGSGLTLEQAEKSLIYKSQAFIYNINSIIDTRILNAKNRNIAKQIFTLNPKRFYILVGAQNSNDKRKGFEYLIEALKKLEKILDVQTFAKLTLIIVAKDVNKGLDDLNIDKIKLDYIKDYRLLSLLYQSIDLYINSSIEDSGPMMVSEALACGTPVVGFNTGVVTNMVLNDYNGYKVENKNSEELAEAIKKIIDLSPDKFQIFQKMLYAK